MGVVGEQAGPHGLVDGSGQGAGPHGSLAYNLLERAQAVVEGALAAAAAHGKVALEREFLPVVGKLERGKHGCKGLALELAAGGGVGCVVGKEGIFVLDGTGLEHQLPVDGEMGSGIHESHAGGVGVDAVDADGCVTRKMAVESHVLVGVGEQTAGHSSL